MKQSIYSVRQVNTYIKNMFTQDILLSRLYVKGEVSNCKYHTSGHIYFSLKDESGAIACIMFAGQRRGLAFAMKNGDKVVVGGSANVYERDGKYQIYAKEITLEGAGLLYERYLALKRELAEMGMFAAEYKQPIPRFIRRLGVVTAPTGAAVQDICTIAARRNPYLQIILYPALVQGEGAPDSIIRGLQTLDRYGVDTIIIGRGGGSIEDLWAFNEEAVARAVFECGTPVISAVGHETDVTITDFVADLRAPTPSAAAELAVDDFRGMFEQITELGRRMRREMENRIRLSRHKQEQLKVKMSYLSPENIIREKRQRLIDLEEHLQTLMQKEITARRHRFELYIEQLKGLSPLHKLNGGFAYVEAQSGKAVKSIAQVRSGDILSVHISDGVLQTEVKNAHPIERRGGSDE